MADNIFADFINNELAQCTRCGKPCRIADNPNPEARLIRRATPESAKKEGLCADCAATAFLKNTPTLMVGIDRNGVTMLLNPRIQATFANLMVVGKSDARPEEINWQRVVDNWALPFPKSKRGKK